MSLVSQLPFLKRLKPLFVFKKTCALVNNLLKFSLVKLIFICLYLVTLIYFIRNEYYYLLIIPALIMIGCFKKNKKLFVLILILTIYILVRMFANIILYKTHPTYLDNERGKIYQVKVYDDYERVFIKCQGRNYYFTSKDLIYSAGDEVIIKGKVEELSGANVPEGFNQRMYYMDDGVVGKITSVEVQIIKHHFHLNIIHEKLYSLLRSNYDSLSLSYLAPLTIGEKNAMDSDIKDSISKIGISHLFVISGLHIELLASFILLLLRKNKTKLKYYLTFFILVIYWIICGLTVSILRVLISFVLSNLLTNKINRFNKYVLNISLVLLINPYYLFKYSFLLSYTVVLGINLISTLLPQEKGIKNFIKTNILISSISTLLTIPILASMGVKVNILAILFNLFFIPFVSYYFLPLSFLTIILPFLKTIYYYHVVAFNYLTTNLSKFQLLSISFPKLPIFLNIIFFILIITMFVKIKKKIRLFIICPTIVLFVILWGSVIHYPSAIYFLSLPIGDSTLISDRGTNILIDTGDGSSDEIITTLNKLGIRSIDGIIVTHGDNDHIGGVIEIAKAVKVKSIFVSYYDGISKDILNTLDPLSKIPIIELSSNDEISIKGHIFKILMPNKKYQNINDNSLVVYFNLFGLDFLITGDMEKEAEEEFIKLYPNIHVDVLKVAHHGSSTSSSEIFLKAVNPRLAVAMNGYRNTFSFPSKWTIETFNKLNIPFYNTIDYGTIYLKRRNSNSNIKIYSSYR